MKCKKLIAGYAMVLLGAIGAGLSAQEVKPANTPEVQSKIIKQLTGDYVIRAGKSDGEDIRQDHLTDVTVKITEKTITTYDRDKQQRYSASYQLNIDKRPWNILMTVIPKRTKDPTAGGELAADEPQLSQGLIELSEDGKKLKIVYALPGGDAPKDFTGGKRENLFELERIPKP